MAVTSALVDSTTRTGSSGTTSTITGAQFGTAFAGRVLLSGLVPSALSNITSGTIGGQTVGNVPTLPASVVLAYALVASGTSGNIVASLDDTDTLNSIGVVALTGAASATPSGTINNGAGGSGNIDVGAGGCVVAYAIASGAGTWTGATGVRTDSTTLSGSGLVLSIATFDNSGGALTNRAISYSTGLGLFAAAFDAAGGGGGVSANPTTAASTSAAGTATVTGKANVSVTGASSTASAGTATVSTATNVSANPTGVSSTASSGTPAATGQANVAPTGVSATASPGTPTVSAKGSTSITGVQGTASAGTPTVTGLANVVLTGAGAASAVGDPTVTVSGSAEALVSGVEAAASAGTPTVTGLANVTLTGANGTAGVGTLAVAIPVVASPAGVSATSAVGTLTETGTANVTPQGAGAAAQSGDITASVPTGVSVTLDGVMATLRAGNITIGAGAVDGSGRSRRDNYTPYRIYNQKELERLWSEQMAKEVKSAARTETAIKTPIALARLAPIIAPQKTRIAAVDNGIAQMIAQARASAEYDDDEESAILLL